MKRLAHYFSTGLLIILFQVTQAKPIDSEVTFLQQNARYNVIDPSTGLTWSVYKDNPTSIYRYEMDSDGSSKRLPTIEELTSLFSRISTALRQNPSGAVGRHLGWLTETGNYPSSTLVTTVEQKTFYKGIFWNNSTKRFEEVLLSGGDLVIIAEVSQ